MFNSLKNLWQFITDTYPVEEPTCTKRKPSDTTKLTQETINAIQNLRVIYPELTLKEFTDKINTLHGLDKSTSTIARILKQKG